MAIQYSSDAALNQSLSNLGGALGSILGRYQNTQKQQQQSSALQQTLQNIPSGASQVQVLQSILGSGIPMDKALEIYKNYKPQEAPRMSENQQEKLIALNRAKNTINSIEKLIEGGNIGKYAGLSFFRNIGEKGQDRAKLEKLGQSLINSVANGLVVRNKQEFNEFKSIITDPDATVANLKGAIDGIKEMVDNELNLRNNPAQMSNMQSINNSNQMPNMQSINNSNQMPNMQSINNSNQMQQRPSLESFFKR